MMQNTKHTIKTNLTKILNQHQAFQQKKKTIFLNTFKRYQQYFLLLYTHFFLHNLYLLRFYIYLRNEEKNIFEISES